MQSNTCFFTLLVFSYVVMIICYEMTECIIIMCIYLLLYGLFMCIGNVENLTHIQEYLKLFPLCVGMLVLLIFGFSVNG